MNEAIWLPALIVLSVGLILGLLLAFRLRSSPSPDSQGDTADLELKLRDLEARRDDLFRRIRAADEDHLSAEEQAALEDAAALTLRDLDRLESQVPGRHPKGKSTRKKAEQPTQPSAEGEVGTAPPTSKRNPLLTGLAFGAVMVVVIGLLVYWAVRDAQPKPPDGMSQMASNAADAPHEGQSPLPPELAPQVANLKARTAANPQDWAAHRELAITLVAGGQFLEAFEEATLVLQQFPEDPDGLLVHGVVRLTMGQATMSLDLLDRVLAQNPSQRQALIYRGLALYQLGNVEQAMDTWDMGLQMVGGSDPEFEELLMMAQSGQSQPAGMTPPGQTATARPAPSAATTPPDTPPDGFALQIELATGAQPAPQAILFVFLRPEGGGPPVAATRITSPAFPMAIVLDASHSMMGAELPDRGILVARVDTDGNVTTTDPTDLVIEIPATKGQLTRVTLGQ